MPGGFLDRCLSCPRYLKGCSGSLVSCMSEGSLVSIMALSLSWYPRCMKVPLSLVLVS